jgi:hypothetical protein
MSASTTSVRLGFVAEPCGDDHDGCCSGQLTFGPDGCLMLSVVCDNCGRTVAVLDSLDYQLAARPGRGLDLAA